MSTTSTAGRTPFPIQWFAKSTQVYKEVKGGGRPGVAQLVLHIESNERAQMTGMIENLLNQHGLQVKDTMGSMPKQEIVRQIIQQLLTSPEYGSMLSWARTQGETQENVENAIRVCILCVHNARKKRVNAVIEDDEDSTTSADNSSSLSRRRRRSRAPIKPRRGTSAFSAPAAVVPAVSPQKQNVLLLVGNMPDPLYKSWNNLTNRSQPTRFEALQAESEKELRKQENPGRVTGFIVDFGGGSRALLSNPDDFDSCLDEWHASSRRGLPKLIAKIDPSPEEPSTSQTESNDQDQSSDVATSIEMRASSAREGEARDTSKDGHRSDGTYGEGPERTEDAQQSTMLEIQQTPDPEQPTTRQSPTLISKTHQRKHGMFEDTDTSPVKRMKAEGQPRRSKRTFVIG